MGNKASASPVTPDPRRRKRSSAASSGGSRSQRSARSSSTGRSPTTDRSDRGDASPTSRPHRLLPETPNRNGSLPTKLRANSPRAVERRSSMTHLSSIQHQLIQKSWKRSQKTGVDCVGSKIFLNIFRVEPSLKGLFGLEDTPGEQIKYDSRFRAHASIFTRTFNYVVSNLDDMESVCTHVQDLGRRHVQFQSRGFKPQYWDIFAEALTECAIAWEGGVRCREAMAAWRVLVAFVIDQMRLGFDRERSLQFEIRKLSMRHPSPIPTITMEKATE